jgi:hypothetical protein
MASKALLRLLFVIVGVGSAWLIFRQHHMIVRLESETQALERRVQQTVTDRRDSTPAVQQVRREPQLSPAPLVNQPLPDVSSKSAVDQWVNRVILLKTRLTRQPQLQSPNLAFATPEDWLYAVFDNNLATDSDCNKSIFLLNNEMRIRINFIMLEASTKFQAANGTPATETAQLVPYFSPSLAPGLIERLMELRPETSK